MAASSCCCYALISTIFSRFCGSSGSSVSVACFNGGGIFCCSNVVIAENAGKEKELSLQDYVRKKLEAPADEAYTTIPISSIDDFDQEVLQAIKDFCINRFRQLCPRETVAERERIIHEGGVRFQIAQKLSGVDLDSRISQMNKRESDPLKITSSKINPLMETERSRFVETVDLIDTYGSKAAFIWQTLKDTLPKEKLNRDQLKIFYDKLLKLQILDQSQLHDLIKKVSKPTFRKLLRLESFCDLGEDIRIFLEMAKKTSNVTKEFVFWDPTQKALLEGDFYRTIKRAFVPIRELGAGVYAAAMEGISLVQDVKADRPVSRIDALAKKLGLEDSKEKVPAIAYIYSVLKNPPSTKYLIDALPQGSIIIKKLGKDHLRSFIDDIRSKSKLKDDSIKILLSIAAEENTEELLAKAKACVSLDSLLKDLEIRV